MFVTETKNEESSTLKRHAAKFSIFPSVASGDVVDVSIQLSIIVLFSIADTFSVCKISFRNQSFLTGFLQCKIQGIVKPVGKVINISLIRSV